MIKPAQLFAISALALTAAAAAPSTAIAQSYAPAQNTKFYSNDGGREGKFALGSAAGILPGDVGEALDEDDKPIPGLTFRIDRVRANESFGKLEGPLTQDRLDAVKKAGGWSLQKGRFSRQPTNRTKCQTTVPKPIQASDKSAILAGQSMPGYVIVPIDLKTALEKLDDYAKAAGGSKQLILPGSKAYVVTYSGVYQSEVTTVREGESTVKIDKVDIKPGTLGVAFARVAKVAIPVGSCS